MPLLAIESSTESCSVALSVGSDLLERQALEPRGHARLILPWAQALLAEAGIGFAGLDGLVVSRGPGSFTSLRIGLGIVQGIALAHDLPVRPVSSLDALALSADPEASSPRLLALLDARMGELYSAAYRAQAGRFERLDEEQLLGPAELELPDEGHWAVTGPGARAHTEALEQRFGDSISFIAEHSWPRARALLQLAAEVEAVPGHRLEPVYLRDQVTG
jgi:tRNA threonylcarbamoyladenosine biosynthesis protein TsaB